MVVVDEPVEIAERTSSFVDAGDTCTPVTTATEYGVLCIHNLISLQTDNNTRSSDVVTLARPSAASSLKITDRSFRYTSPYLWN